MDGYSLPKDAQKMVWEGHKTPFHINHYSDEEDDSYSQPYNCSAGPGSHHRQNSSNSHHPDGIYEVSPTGLSHKGAAFDYDVPPSRSNDGDSYSRLHTNGAQPATSSHGAVKTDNAYNHTTTWAPHKGKPDQNEASHTSSLKSTGHGFRSEQIHFSLADLQKRPSGDRNKHPSGERRRQTSGETPDFFNRQKGITPRQTSDPADSEHRSGERRRQTSGETPDFFHRQKGIRQTSDPSDSESTSPPVYEEAWDTAAQRKKLEMNLQLARSISATSDKFEDALEHQADDPTHLHKPRVKQTDPVTGGTYEEAWDLNRGLEEKLRRVKLMHSGEDTGEEGESNYNEPWDSAQKQRELEEKIQAAQCRDSEARGQAAQSREPKARAEPKNPGENQVYEEAWDTKKGLAGYLQMSQSLESGGGGMVRSGKSVPYSVGEPINAMIPLQNQDWYHGNISRDDAESILRVCKVGSYLVRDSSDRCHYTLSIKSPRMVIHIQIDQCRAATDSRLRYILGKNSKAFFTIPGMIDHYTQHPVPIRGAEHIILMHPVQCHWSGPEESRA